MEYLFIYYANFGVFGLFSLIHFLFSEVMGLVYSVFIHLSTTSVHFYTNYLKKFNFFCIKKGGVPLKITPNNLSKIPIPLSIVIFSSIKELGQIWLIHDF